MPEPKQRIGKGVMIFTIFLVLMVGVTFLPVAKWTKIVSIMALAALYVYLRRSFFYFAKAAKLLQKDNTNPVVWETFKKAIAAGMEDERLHLVGSAFIQQGDADYGVKVLEDLIAKTKKQDIKNQAITSLSMGYWRQGKLDEACNILLDLEKSGYSDDNMFVNLETYLLENGNTEEAYRILEKRAQTGPETSGMLDNRGWYNILSGDWDKASDIYDELINERNAKFPEAYLHAAQVKVHNGDISGAIECLGLCLEKRFLLTCGTGKEYVETLKTGLENPDTREAFAKAMDESSALVSDGKKFPGYEKACEFDRSVLEIADGSKSDDSFSDDSFSDDEDDDREPNTDLDDDDYESDDPDEDVDEDAVNTDVDDDDREPNTDLDENDN